VRIFISWSGERSRNAATALDAWLRPVLQAVEPWVSVDDIEKGVRWNMEIATLLEESRFGIICLTPENLESRWLHFEAGALSKTKDARVCPLLVDLTSSQVQSPLNSFQLTTTKKEDVYQLIRDINAAVARCDEKSVSESVLLEIFETYWPRLEEKLNAIAANRPADMPARRSQDSILDELVTIVRSLERRQAAADFERQSAAAIREAIATQVLSDSQQVPRRVDDIVADLARRVAEQSTPEEDSAKSRG
jgi:hypothetical protein